MSAQSKAVVAGLVTASIGGAIFGNKPGIVLLAIVVGLATWQVTRWD